MANNLSSNVTNKVARVFLDAFESNRVLTKTVDTQLLSNQFNPASGTTVNFKRPHDYVAHDTADGDISGETKSSILSGYATGTVQNYITVATEWTGKEEALQLDQLTEILAPAATRACTELERRLGTYMIKNCNLSYGTPGTAVDAWGDVAGAGAHMRAMGVPMGDWYYAMNPYSAVDLANAQNGLYAADGLVKTAWERAQISGNFGGLKALTCDSLPSYTSGTASDRAGAINGTPTATYVGHKDTMIQSIPVDGFTASATIKAGEIVEVTGKFRINLNTKDDIIDSSGAQIKWRGVVNADVTLDGTGAGTLTVAGPAINESGGQYNTVDAALADNDVITVLGSASTVYQPSMFYHKQAFGLGTVKLPKLYSTDTVATTKDGMSIRVSKYSDGDTNTQKIRFDLLPAFVTFNPFFAGQGFGV